MHLFGCGRRPRWAICVIRCCQVLLWVGLLPLPSPQACQENKMLRPCSAEDTTTAPCGKTRRLCASARDVIPLSAATCITVPKLSRKNFQLFRLSRADSVVGWPDSAHADSYRLNREIREPSSAAFGRSQEVLSPGTPRAQRGLRPQATGTDPQISPIYADLVF